ALGSGSHTVRASYSGDANVAGSTATVGQTVTAPPPTITSFSPTAGGAGTRVTIRGSNFVSGATTVTFKGLAASGVTVNSTTQITVNAPTPRSFPDTFVDQFTPSVQTSVSAFIGPIVVTTPN